MSVWRTTYLIYGYKITNEDEKDIIDEHYEELCEEGPYSNIFNNNKSDQTFVYDYMCGNYIYVGIKVAKLDEDDDDIDEKIDIKKLEKLSSKLNEYKKKWPDYLQKIVKGKKEKLYFFIHAH